MIKSKKKPLLNKYQLLKKSWLIQGKLFFKESTLHGVRYIAESSRPPIERFMWFVCVSIGTIATSVIICNLWKKFQTNPTITGLDTDFHNWDVPFPAITVCPQSPANLKNVEMHIQETTGNNESSQHELLFYSNLVSLSYATWTNFSENYSSQTFISPETDLKQLIFNLVYKCEEVFLKCFWKSYTFNCCDGFFPVFTENGFCYTFNSRHYERKIPGTQKILPEFNMQYIQETDIKWSMKFQVKTMDPYFLIYILNSDDIAGIDTQPQHIWDFRVENIMFSVKQTYTTLDTKQLSMKQRQCAFPGEIKLKVETYSYSACTRECRMKTAMKLCNCIPFFYPTMNGSFRHCKIIEFECINRHLEEIMSTHKCTCYLGCSNTVYEIEKLDTLSNDQEKVLECKFVSWPMVRYKREVLFGWVDLLVSFGGIAGLFLGFSLLSGAEIIYYFTMRAFCMVVKEEKSGRKMQKVSPITYRPRKLSDPIISPFGIEFLH